MGVINEEKVNFSRRQFQRRSEILYVTTASPYNSITLNNTLRFLQDNFQTRGNSDKDVWLIGLDIPHDTDVHDRYAKVSQRSMPDAALEIIAIPIFRLLQPFIDMDLDLDDDVYLYQVGVQRSIEIYQLYEVYKIHRRGEPVLNKIGNSTTIDCCNFVIDGKNVRRHDLRVCR